MIDIDDNKVASRDFAKVLVMYGRMASVLARIKYTMESAGVLPVGICVCAPSGVGKSSLCDYILRSNRANSTPEQERYDVIRVSLSPGALPEDVMRALLLQMGIKDTRGYTKFSLEDFLYTQLRECEVRLIMIDEFQHLVRRSSRDVNEKACDFVKTLMDITGIPVILLGVEKGRKLFKLDDQLATRFSEILTIERMGHSGLKSLPEFKKFLNDLQKLYPVESIDWSKDEVALRFLLASDGNLRRLKHILVQALMDSRKTAGKTLSLKDFEEAYMKVRGKEHKIFNQRGQLIKPFSSTLACIKSAIEMKHA
mgnify:CR=1 FL=1|tara:strand:- start:3028 stop:3960 length:933 start_codon:yes stop_codon:yes gene_type:complete